MKHLIVVHYDALISLAAACEGRAAHTRAVLKRLNITFEDLEDGGKWRGRAASAFYYEYQHAILPTLRRLSDFYIQLAAEIRQTARTLAAQEESAALLFGREQMRIGVVRWFDQAIRTYSDLIIEAGNRFNKAMNAVFGEETRVRYRTPSALLDLLFTFSPLPKKLPAKWKKTIDGLYDLLDVGVGTATGSSGFWENLAESVASWGTEEAITGIVVSGTPVGLIVLGTDAVVQIGGGIIHDYYTATREYAAAILGLDDTSIGYQTMFNGTEQFSRFLDNVSLGNVIDSGSKVVVDFGQVLVEPVWDRMQAFVNNPTEAATLDLMRSLSAHALLVSPNQGMNMLTTPFVADVISDELAQNPQLTKEMIGDSLEFVGSVVDFGINIQRLPSAAVEVIGYNTIGMQEMFTEALPLSDSYREGALRALEWHKGYVDDLGYLANRFLQPGTGLPGPFDRMMYDALGSIDFSEPFREQFTQPVTDFYLWLKGIE